MISSEQNLENFNKTAMEFLTRMRDTYPNETKISLYIFTYSALEKTNARKPVEMFMESLRPYGLQIMTKDEQFFKQEQYVNKAESISGKMGLIKYWETMTQDTKNNIWKYIQILYINGMGALGQLSELQEILNKIPK